MGRSRPTDEHRRAQRAEALQRLEQATQALLSSEGWRGWLRTRATLHRYSTNNTLMIWAQASQRGFTPTHVAGFRAWLRLGRCVRKGERGLRVFAPMPVRRREDDDQEPTPEKSGEAERDDRTRMRFGLATVFDISQTDPLPDAEPAPMRPPYQPLSGDSHAWLIDPLCGFARSIGYRVAWTPGLKAYGTCDRNREAIELRVGMAPNQEAATLIHELAHALVGPGRGLAYDVEEVIAEATSYIVTSAAGLDGSCASVPYIASWGGGDPLAAVRDAVELIDSLANRLQDVLDDPGRGKDEARRVIAAAEAAGYAREPSMPDIYEGYLHRDAQEAAGATAFFFLPKCVRPSPDRRRGGPSGD